MYAELVFPLPFRNSFTYSVPAELKHSARIGVRAVAPFGKRTLTGFIIKTKDKCDIKEKIKPLYDILDDVPIFDEERLRFYEWVSDYYLSSLGEALRLAVPYGLDVESKRKIIVDKLITVKLLAEIDSKNSMQRQILEVIKEKEEISFSTLQRLTGKKNIHSTVRTLEKKGALTILTTLVEAKVKIKTAKYVQLVKSLSEVYELIPEIENRSPQQVKILLELTKKKSTPVPLAALLKKAEAPGSSVESLEKKGVLKVFDKEVERKYEEEFKEAKTEFVLTKQQKASVDEISKHIDSSSFKPYLLHGITGSGKTQVYIELIKKVIAAGKTALILVPEISLTPQITVRLFNNFGELVSVQHSRMSIGERYDAWRRLLNGKSKVVVGARSALFAPIKEIGIIVVDEEHDASYKQWDFVPKYHARDAAILLAKYSNCPVVLGSATPSIETMYNALNNKYTLLNLPERIDNAKLPKIELVNVIVEKKKGRMQNVFSSTLLDKIADRIAKKEGTIILQNRRGFSTQIFCDDCGEIETCTNCSVPMVYHINKNYLQCHYCGLTIDVPKACTTCGSLSIKYFGTGTERVEDELEFYLPGAKIRRIDSDSVSRKNSLSILLRDFSRGDIDILVGTQMVSKGLDISRVTLVGVISAETSLWMPDFRADERTFQLLTQVSGRAGRSKVEGEVIIQTQNEKNFTLKKVIADDYKGFYEKEIRDRQQMGYPPFTRLCLIEAKDPDEEGARGAIFDYFYELKVYNKYLKITPPSTALIARLKGNYRFQILIKSSREVDPGGAILRKAVLDSFIEFNRKSRFKDVKLFFDVDPQSIM